MIKKKYRLNENEVKKVLKFWKPFFSYWVVLNKIKSKLSYSRFGIVVWAKSVNHNISRNFFRRRFYDLVKENIKENSKQGLDVVFVVKKKTKLNLKEKESIFSFDKDIKFLNSKINN